MPNTEVTGRVVNNQGAPLGDYHVVALDSDDFDNDYLGEVDTNPDGTFKITYSPDAYKGSWPFEEAAPAIRFVVTNWQHQSYATRIYGQPLGATYDVGDVTVEEDVNTAVEGIVVDGRQAMAPVQGIRVEAWDIDDPAFGSDFLGSATTDANGHFRIEYYPSAYSSCNDFLLLNETTPDVELRFFDWSDTEQDVRPTWTNVTAPTLDAKTIKLLDVTENSRVAGVVSFNSGAPAQRFTVIAEDEALPPQAYCAPKGISYTADEWEQYCRDHGIDPLHASASAVPNPPPPPPQPNYSDTYYPNYTYKQIGFGVTDDEGKFDFLVHPTKIRRRMWVHVICKTTQKRVLTYYCRRSDPPSSLLPATYHIPHPLVIDEGLCGGSGGTGGWVVTPKPTVPPRLSDGNAVEPLLNTPRSWQSIVAAIEGTPAGSTIRIAQDWFSPAAQVFDPGRRISAALVERAANGVNIRVLIGSKEGATLEYLGDELDANGNATVEVRGMSRMRARVLLIIDAQGVAQTAFVMGAPFVQCFYGDAARVPFDVTDERQRVPDSDSAITDRAFASLLTAIRTASDDSDLLNYRPVHDVTLKLSGPCVADIDQLFVDAWRASGGDALAPGRAASALTANQTVQALVTAPTTHDNSALFNYENALYLARACIYLESSRLTTGDVIRPIMRAVYHGSNARAIILLDQNPAGGFDAAQNRLIQAAGLMQAQAIGLFSLWVVGQPRTANGKPTLTPACITSDLVIVDDTWAGFGTPLDRGSLHATSRGNVVIAAALIDAHEPKIGGVDALRRALWEKHLREAINVFATPNAGNATWLDLWKHVARDDATALVLGSTPSVRVLPYVEMIGSEQQATAAVARALGAAPDLVRTHLLDAYEII